MAYILHCLVVLCCVLNLGFKDEAQRYLRALRYVENIMLLEAVSILTRIGMESGMKELPRWQ
jgi:hypothetical protein